MYLFSVTLVLVNLVATYHCLCAPGEYEHKDPATQHISCKICPDGQISKIATKNSSCQRVDEKLRNCTAGTWGFKSKGCVPCPPGTASAAGAVKVQECKRSVPPLSMISTSIVEEQAVSEYESLPPIPTPTLVYETTPNAKESNGEDISNNQDNKTTRPRYQGKSEYPTTAQHTSKPEFNPTAFDWMMAGTILFIWLAFLSGVVGCVMSTKLRKVLEEDDKIQKCFGRFV